MLKSAQKEIFPLAHFWFVSNSAWFYDLVHISEMVFPEYDVHFIAVNDGVDSAKGDSEFTAIRNIFNEIFAKDASKKIKATWQSKGRSGEHLCIIPPYGYMKDADRQVAATEQRPEPHGLRPRKGFAGLQRSHS